jgi:hypothetical protein
MTGAHDPNIVVGELALCGLFLGLLWCFFNWIRKTPISPDPWGEETEKLLQGPDAVEVCHHCFTPQSSEGCGWFCEHCGSAAGPYNNLMPFVYVFSQGEVLRNGVNDKLRSSPLIIIGYLLVSASAYTVFAPVYWVALFKNLKRHRQDQLQNVDNDPGNSAPDARL